MNLRIYWEAKVQKNPTKIFLYYDDEAIGYGETRPIASNKSRKGRAANRRSEFNIVQEDAGGGP